MWIACIKVQTIVPRSEYLVLNSYVRAHIIVLRSEFLWFQTNLFIFKYLWKIGIYELESWEIECSVLT